MKKFIATLLLGSVLLFMSGCSYSMLVDSSTPGIQDEKRYDAFDTWFTAVKHKIEKDDNYKKIDFDNDHDIEWFMTLLFKVWNKNITHEEFLKEGIAAYPNNRSAFEYFLNELPKN